jgi:hypothetical protein
MDDIAQNSLSYIQSPSHPGQPATFQEWLDIASKLSINHPLTGSTLVPSTVTTGGGNTGVISEAPNPNNFIVGGLIVASILIGLGLVTE